MVVFCGGVVDGIGRACCAKIRTKKDDTYGLCVG